MGRYRPPTMPTPSPCPTLEVPVDSIEAARLAIPFADRLELCHDLSSEGWTPRSELVRAAREAVEGTACTIVAMIRPELPGARRELDVAAFTVTPKVLDASLREIEACAKAGAHSVAVGLLTADGFLDVEACARLKILATELGLVPAFLRTFDLLIDRRRAMRDIASLGFVRVVSAGVYGWDASVATLHERLETLAADVNLAESLAATLGRPPVEIVPGGGVRASNAKAFLGVSPHLHASCRRDGRISHEELAALRGRLR
jgi:copper homeostasis protein